MISKFYNSKVNTAKHSSQFIANTLKVNCPSITKSDLKTLIISNDKKYAWSCFADKWYVAQR